MLILSKRVRERYSVWLERGVNSSIISSINEKLVNTGHSFRESSVFKVIYKASRKPPNTVIFHLVNTAKAITILLEKPRLYVQKKLVQPLLRPWLYTLVIFFSLLHSLLLSQLSISVLSSV